MTTPRRGEDSRVDETTKTVTGFFGENGIIARVNGVQYDAVFDTDGSMVVNLPSGRYQVVFG